MGDDWLEAFIHLEFLQCHDQLHGPVVGCCFVFSVIFFFGKKGSHGMKITIKPFGIIWNWNFFHPFFFGKIPLWVPQKDGFQFRKAPLLPERILHLNLRFSRSEGSEKSHAGDPEKCFEPWVLTGLLVKKKLKIWNKNPILTTTCWKLDAAQK